MNAPTTIAEIRARHPFPWRDEVYPNGIMKLIDANNVEVSLFAILAHCVLTTNAIAKQGASAT